MSAVKEEGEGREKDGRTERELKELRKKATSDIKFSSGGLPVCRLCGRAQQDLIQHIVEAHDVGIVEYQEKYPDWPIQPMSVGGLAKTLSYVKREKRLFSVRELFGFWWDSSTEEDKLLEGFVEPGPFTPEIDTSYVFNRETCSVFLLALYLKDKLLIYGPTGCGKTSMVVQAGARLNYNVVRINFDAGITRSDLIGQWVVKGKEMEFSYGILPSAMVLPGTIIIFDEADSMSDECCFVLQRPLEQESQLLLMEKGEEIITLHEDNMFCSTSNTAGMGDDTGLYTQGTKIQNYAQINRYSLTIAMDYLPAKEEQQILLKRFSTLNKVEAKVFIQVINTVRDAFLKGEVSVPLSTRDAINWAEKYTYWGDIFKAAKYCFINRMPLEDREVVNGILKRAIM